jgi:putative tryptophan/tyrosine transport system substrate-binding protein
LIASLARPGGNFTGFSNYESVGGKWLELLKEIAPATIRALVIHNPENASNIESLHAIEKTSGSLGIQSIPAEVHDTNDIERQIAAFGQQPHGGLIVLVVRRQTIIAI